MMLPVIFILLWSSSLGWAADHPTDQQSPTENGRQELMAAEGGEGIGSEETHLQEALIQSQNQAEAEAGSDDVKDVHGDGDAVKDGDGDTVKDGNGVAFKDGNGDGDAVKDGDGDDVKDVHGDGDAVKDVHGDGYAVNNVQGKQVIQDILEHSPSHVPTNSTGNHVIATEASEGLNSMDEHQGVSALVYDHEGDEVGTDSEKKSVPETSEQFTSLDIDEEIEGISTLVDAMSIGGAGCHPCSVQVNPGDHDLRSSGSTNSTNGDADSPDSTQPVGATGLLIEGGSENVKTDGDSNEVSLKESKANAEPRHMVVDTDETLSLKDSSKQTAAASQSSSDSTEVLPQPSTEPSLPPPLEFAVAANSHSINSNLHSSNNGATIFRRTAYDILNLINNIIELHEFNRNGTRNMGVRRRLRGIQQANSREVEELLGSSFDFDSNSAAVYHNQQYTLIMVPLATTSIDLSGLAAIARNQRLIIDVDGNLPFLIYYDPFANQFLLAFHAAFSDINEGFLRWFSGEVFHNVIVQILNYILDEVDGQSRVLDQGTFLIVIVLLFEISELIHDSAFGAGIRNLVVHHKVNSRLRKDEVYRQQPSPQACSSTQGGTNSCTTEQQNGIIVSSRTAALDLMTKLNDSKFNLMVMEETSKRDEQGSKPGSPEAKTNSGTGTKKKKGKKNKGVNWNNDASNNSQDPSAEASPNHTGVLLDDSQPQPDISLPVGQPDTAKSQGQKTARVPTSSQSQSADVPNHQEPGAPASSGTLLDNPLPPPDIPLQGGQPNTANNQGKTSQGAGTKKVSMMTQSKEEDQDPPSGA